MSIIHLLHILSLKLQDHHGMDSSNEEPVYMVGLML